MMAKLFYLKILLESQQQVSEEVSVQRLSMVSNIYLINNIDKLIIDAFIMKILSKYF